MAYMECLGIWQYHFWQPLAWWQVMKIEDPIADHADHAVLEAASDARGQ